MRKHRTQAGHSVGLSAPARPLPVKPKDCRDRTSDEASAGARGQLAGLELQNATPVVLAAGDSRAGSPAGPASCLATCLQACLSQ